MGNKEGIALALGLLGRIALLQDEAVKARSSLEESLAFLSSCFSYQFVNGHGSSQKFSLTRKLPHGRGSMCIA